jgi:hypothetical protein
MNKDYPFSFSLFLRVYLAYMFRMTFVIVGPPKIDGGLDSVGCLLRSQQFRPLFRMLSFSSFSTSWHRICQPPCPARRGGRAKGSGRPQCSSAWVLAPQLACTLIPGPFVGLSPRAPTRSRGPFEGSACLAIVIPQAFSSTKRRG